MMKPSSTLLLLALVGCGPDFDAASSSDALGFTQKVGDSRRPGSWAYPSPHCSGVTGANVYGVDPPTPPQGYQIRAGVSVANSAQLASRVANGIVEDIILENGVYDRKTFLTLADGDRLWARNAGQAVLRFGLNIPHAGTEVHGLVIAITNRTKAVRPSPSSPITAAILVWGDGAGIRVEDSWIDGDDVVAHGIYVGAANGFTAERLEIVHFLRGGIVLGELDFDPTTHQRHVLRDLSIAYIDDPSHFSVGRDEAGLFLAQPAIVSRARIRHVGTVGIATGNIAYGGQIATIGHVDIDHTGLEEDFQGTGVYIEKRNHGTSLVNFCIGPDSTNGVKLEWQDTAPEPITSTTIEFGYISSPRVGVNIGEYNENTRLTALTIDGASWSGVNYRWAVGTLACGLTFVNLGSTCEFTQEINQLALPPPPPSACLPPPC